MRRFSRNAPSTPGVGLTRRRDISRKSTISSIASVYSRTPSTKQTQTRSRNTVVTTRRSPNNSTTIPRPGTSLRNKFKTSTNSSSNTRNVNGSGHEIVATRRSSNRPSLISRVNRGSPTRTTNNLNSNPTRSPTSTVERVGPRASAGLNRPSSQAQTQRSRFRLNTREARDREEQLNSLNSRMNSMTSPSPNTLVTTSTPTAITSTTPLSSFPSSSLDSNTDTKTLSNNTSNTSLGARTASHRSPFRRRTFRNSPNNPPFSTSAAGSESSSEAKHSINRSHHRSSYRNGNSIPIRSLLNSDFNTRHHEEQSIITTPIMTPVTPVTPVSGSSSSTLNSLNPVPNPNSIIRAREEKVKEKEKERETVSPHQAMSGNPNNSHRSHRAHLVGDEPEPASSAPPRSSIHNPTSTSSSSSSSGSSSVQSPTGSNTTGITSTSNQTSTSPSSNSSSSPSYTYSPAYLEFKNRVHTRNAARDRENTNNPNPNSPNNPNIPHYIPNNNASLTAAGPDRSDRSPLARARARLSAAASVPSAQSLGTAPPGVDSAVWAAIPVDMRAEVLQSLPLQVNILNQTSHRARPPPFPGLPERERDIEGKTARDPYTTSSLLSSSTGSSVGSQTRETTERYPWESEEHKGQLEENMRRQREWRQRQRELQQTQHRDLDHLTRLYQTREQLITLLRMFEHVQANNSELSQALLPQFFETLQRTAAVARELGVRVNISQIFEEKKKKKPTLTAAQLNSVPVHKAVAGQVFEDPCCICLEMIDQNQSVSSLACTHSFHADCLRTWLNRANNCPLCKKDVVNLKELAVS